MAGYTPTTAEVRNAWWRDQCPKHDLDFDDIYNAAFDRWLDRTKAEAAAEALNEFADAVRMPATLFYDGDGPITANDLLRQRAAAIRKENANV